jgi:hypothetical protein
VILTAHQPVYLPWIGLFHKIAMADTFVFFDEVQYQPKDWNNRNKIKAGAEAVWLTVPVLRTGHREKTFREIEINNDVPWQRKHWRTLSLHYRRAPHFDTYAPFFEDVYARSWQYLADLNEHMLRWFLDVLGIRMEFLRASDLHFKGTKSDLVLDMCMRLGADVYIFGALGRDYAEVERFEAASIKAIFQDYHHPVYPQQYGEFISHLSIVDLLFNCGSRSLEVVMGGQDAMVKRHG